MDKFAAQPFSLLKWPFTHFIIEKKKEKKTHTHTFIMISNAKNHITR
jgi:hypothetical protein